MHKCHVLLAACGNMIGSVFQYGYGLGVMNSLKDSLKVIFDNSENIPFGFTTAFSLTQALWAAGGAVGSQIGGFTGKKLGRKNTLLLNNVFIISGLFLQFLTFQLGTSYYWLLAGRFLNGIGCGVAMTISPVYLIENSPIRHRGAFGMSYSLVLNFGLFVSYLLGMMRTDFNFNGLMDTSAFVVGFPIIFALFQLIILPFVYDSPDSLEQRGHHREAELAGQYYGLYGKYSIWSAVANTNPVPLGRRESIPLYKIIKNETYYKPLAVGCMMMVIQQLTGISAIHFYSTSIFEAAGMSNPKVETVIVGVIKILTTVVMIFVTGRFGRKTLMQASLIGMFVCSVTTAALLISMNDNASNAISMTTVAFVLMFVIFFQFGTGPIPGFITSELFVASERTRAASITVLVNWICNAIMGAVFPYMAEAIGGSVFFIFATFILVSSIYLHFFVPETKDKTISDVQKFFESEKINKVHPNDSDAAECNASVVRRFSSWKIGLQN